MAAKRNRNRSSNSRSRSRGSAYGRHGNGGVESYSRYSRYADEQDFSEGQGPADDYGQDGYGSYDDGYGYNDQFEDDADVASRYTRSSSRDRYAPQLRKHRRNVSILKRIVIAIVAVLAIGGGLAFAYVHAINSNLSDGLDSDINSTLTRSNLNKPFYMLLLGTDESLERDGDEYYAGNFRTDTIILARIDPQNQTVSLISLPRDTMTDMGEYGTQKLNAAYAIGGASAAVQEVSDLSGVGISHFALVDMDGLKEVVDALGGIEVDVPMTIDDADAGGHLDSGLQTLNGDQALILCRSREAFEEAGVSGDLARAANQRLVLQAIANKILQSDATTIASTVTTLSNYVTTDLSVQKIVTLAQAFAGMDTANNIWTATMPTESQYTDDLWYEVVKQDEWKAMMQRVDQGLPPTESTEIDSTTGMTLASAGGESDGSGNSEITKTGYINVRNGTPQAGLGAAIASRLESAGYYVVDVASADADTYEETLVIYSDNSQEAEAEQIANAIGGKARAVQNDGSWTMHDDFMVVLGSDILTPTNAVESAIGSLQGFDDSSYASSLDPNDFISDTGSQGASQDYYDGSAGGDPYGGAPAEDAYGDGPVY